MTNRVFILEPPRATVDTSKALKFGDIEYVFNGDRHESVFKHRDFGADVVQRLKSADFDPSLDFMCVVGSMVGVSVALVAMAQTWDSFKVLFYNSILDEYVEKRFDRKDWNHG